MSATDAAALRPHDDSAPKFAPIVLPAPYRMDVVAERHNKTDANLMLSKSFRVAWGPDGTIIVPGSKKPGRVNVYKLETSPYLSEPVATAGSLQYADVIRSTLEIQLKHSKVISQNTSTVDSPAREYHLETKHRIALIDDLVAAVDQALNDHRPSHSDVSARDAVYHTQTASEVFKLLNALLVEPAFNGNYNVEQFRRARVSDWLQSVLRKQSVVPVKNAKSNGVIDDEAELNAIFHHLSTRNVSEAVRIAVHKKDYHLAMLIAQSGGTHSNKMLLKRQMIDWAQQGVSDFIHTTRLKIYALLAGSITDSAVHIVTFEGLDWLRCFGLHLWYETPLSLPIASALAQYEALCYGPQSFDSQHAEQRPLPAYVSAGKSTEITTGYEDILYRLLNLLSGRVRNVSTVITPETHTPYILDVSLCWHVYSLLDQFIKPILTFEQRVRLHVSFASQLELQGLWVWSVFVLQHINSVDRRAFADAARRSAITDLLDRRCGAAPSQTLDFIVNSLSVPRAWVEQSLALHALSEHRFYDQAIHLINALSFERAHAVVLADVAPAYITDNTAQQLTDLLTVLKQLKPRVKFTPQTETYYAYVRAVALIDQFASASTSSSSSRAYDRESALQELSEINVVTLCQWIASLPRHNLQASLCASTMTREIIRRLHALMPALEHAVPPTGSTAELIRQIQHVYTSLTPSLPLMEDDRLVVVSYLSGKLYETVASA